MFLIIHLTGKRHEMRLQGGSVVKRIVLLITVLTITAGAAQAQVGNLIWADEFDNLDNWIKLTGLGFGSKVALYDGDKLVATREVRSATGFCAQEPATVHFGAKAGKSYTAKISVPGSEATSMKVKGGQFITVK